MQVHRKLGEIELPLYARFPQDIAQPLNNASMEFLPIRKDPFATNTRPLRQTRRRRRGDKRPEAGERGAALVAPEGVLELVKDYHRRLSAELSAALHQAGKAPRLIVGHGHARRQRHEL